MIPPAFRAYFIDTRTLLRYYFRMKTCSKCGVKQPPDNYYGAKGTRDGLRGECKSCFARRAKAHYQANSEREIARVKEWQQANRERVSTTQRKRRTRLDVKRRERASYLT